MAGVMMGDRDDWRIDFARYGGPYIVECGLTDANPEVGDTIAKVMVRYGADGRHVDFPTTQRRSYVIAAAPMLLAALQAMLATHGKPMRDEWMNDAAFEHAKKVDAQARAAIAKAIPAVVATNGDGK